MDRGAWWAAVHGVAQSQTWLKRLSIHACIGEGNSNPLQYSCLENPRDRGAWWAAVYGVAQSWTRLKWRSISKAPCSLQGEVLEGLHILRIIQFLAFSDWLLSGCNTLLIRVSFMCFHSLILTLHSFSLVNSIWLYECTTDYLTLAGFVAYLLTSVPWAPYNYLCMNFVWIQELYSFQQITRSGIAGS